MKIHHTSRPTKVHYHLHNSPSIVSILSQINAVRPVYVFRLVTFRQVPSHVSLQRQHTQHKFDHNNTW